MNRASVRLAEWETARPVKGSLLEGRNFEGDQSGRLLAEQLASAGRLEVLELVRGLEVRTTSFVGRVQLGEIEVTIQPKISGAPLLSLFRYAYGLRDLHFYGDATFGTERGSFQDLLIQQLWQESQELIARGFHRDYLARSEDLGSPRGRINLERFAREIRLGRSTLPCTHHPRSEDNLLNQVLLGGIVLGARLTTDADLRARMHRLRKLMSATITPHELNAPTLQDAWNFLDRRTKSYEPALTIIELLLSSSGVSLSDESVDLNLRGFLFDMNRFFQALMSRFLRDNLVDFEVHDEKRLKGMFAYDPAQNPRSCKAPTPKPDFVLIRGNRTVAVLDAKYRDLWEHTLPASILYQLGIYALGHRQAERKAAILYPTLNPRARQQSIIIRDASTASSQATIELRPVDLTLLNDLIRSGIDFGSKERRCKFAYQLAFGATHAEPGKPVVLAINEKRSHVIQTGTAFF